MDPNLQPSQIHNPDNVSQESLNPEEGWRFLNDDEIIKKTRPIQLPLFQVEAWEIDGWRNGYWGESENITYRTKLTPEQLKKARGL